MLKSKYSRRRLPKKDWFPSKVYLHFDGKMSRADAEALVANKNAICRHSFLPLIAFDKRDRRYRRMKGRPTEITTKTRRIAYCSNRDACIFSYYAHLLNEKYEYLIRNLEIDDVVIGYRQIGSNIDLAMSAFSEVRARGSCVAFAFDISGFFDNIDHGVLKRNWCRVLGVPVLPDDHYAIFKRITHFSTVNRSACLRRLGYKPTSRDRDITKRPLCSIDDYRRIIKGKGGTSGSLVEEWKKDYRNSPRHSAVCLGR